MNCHHRPNVMKEFKFWIGLIGALLSAAPIISLIQKLFNIGLMPIFANAVTYYRGITYPLVDWLRYAMSYIPFLDLYRFIFSWFMSLEAYRDFTVLSFVVTAALLRRPITATPPPNRSASVVIIIFSLLIAPTLIPLVFTFYLLAAWDKNPNDRSNARYFLLNLLIAFTAAAAFFGANELMK